MFPRSACSKARVGAFAVEPTLIFAFHTHDLQMKLYENIDLYKGNDGEDISQ
jgi:hypothetical protein